MIQLFITIFGLTSIWLSMGNWEPGRRWAPIVGLAGQPFWFAHALQIGGWGIFALTCAYTIVFLRGAWVQWGMSQRVRRWRIEWKWRNADPDVCCCGQSVVGTGGEICRHGGCRSIKDWLIESEIDGTLKAKWRKG